MSAAQQPPVADVDEVAAALRISRWTVYDGVKAGTFPLQPIRIGRTLRFRRSDLNALLGIEAA
jgi:excisionase family DNA binding protein